MSFLFDKSPLPVSQYGHQIEPKTLARREDPATSKMAAEQKSCGLSEVQALFVSTLRKSHIPLTANEVAENAIPIEDVTKIRQVMAKRETLRKRAGELDQWIKKCDARVCRVTGKMATTYEVK